jgi:16S rRNA (guanine(966)-N(2))-methyltransferase RsmD
MRVIAGTAKGRKLKGVPGDRTRPITDRTKESLFNILGPWIIEARVLDLFGGTGSVGIEALSRGAAQATMLDKSRAAIRTMAENLRATDLADRALLKQGDTFDFLIEAPPAELAPFDLIYVAPPQYQEMWSRTLFLLDRNLAAWLQPEGIVVAQIHPKEYQELALEHLVLFDQRQYGSTLLCFYEWLSEGASDGDSAAG